MSVTQEVKTQETQGGVRVLYRPPQAIVLIGAGGTGGALLQPLCRLLYSLDDLAAQNRDNPALLDDEDSFDPDNQGAPPLMIIDGDTVEHYNIRRQMFIEEDVHKKKAHVLASRYSAAFGIDVSSYPDYLSPGISRDALDEIIPEESVVIGAVDNAGTRHLIHEKLSRYSDVVYLDSGNAGIPAPEAGTANTANELTAVDLGDKGYDGQVVCGARVGCRQVIPFPAEVFPDLIEVEDPGDRLPTEIPCGEAVVSQPQRLITNVLAATVLLSYLTPILTEGVVPNSTTFFDARKGFQRSQKAGSLSCPVSS